MKEDIIMIHERRIVYIMDMVVGLLIFVCDGKAYVQLWYCYDHSLRIFVTSRVPRDISALISLQAIGTG